MTDTPVWTLSVVVTIALVVILALLFYRSVVHLFDVVIVLEDSVGIVNKKSVVIGQHRTLLAGAIIALHGEAGLQADALAQGLHISLGSKHGCCTSSPCASGTFGMSHVFDSPRQSQRSPSL